MDGLAADSLAGCFAFAPSARGKNLRLAALAPRSSSAGPGARTPGASADESTSIRARGRICAKTKEPRLWTGPMTICMAGERLRSHKGPKYYSGLPVRGEVGLQTSARRARWASPLYASSTGAGRGEASPIFVFSLYFTSLAARPARAPAGAPLSAVGRRAAPPH